MTTDENIMTEMLDRATNPERDSVDELAVQMFCMVLRSNSQHVQKSLEMIVAKISSQNVTEAVRGIALLEECMTKCGADFQDEVAKFRFLNSLIRLVSKNFQGATTPISVKQRIMECLLLWTTEFAQKTKIREAYDSLCKEGEVEHGNLPSAAMAKRQSILGIDEAMLASLIKSGNPENFKRANLLIQHRVNQESRRMELQLQHKSELEQVQTTVALLNQMLDALEPQTGVQVAATSAIAEDSETMNLIRELYIECKRHKPVLQRLPELIDSSDEELIVNTLESNDLLLAVMKRYKDIVVHPVAQPTTAAAKVQPLNPTPVIGSSNGTAADLLAGLLAENLPAPIVAEAAAAAAVAPAPAAANHHSNTIDELSDIFGANVLSGAAAQALHSLNELFGSSDLLEPINVFEESKKSASSDNCIDSAAAEKRTLRELRAIDQISEELFKENLQSNERIGSFKKESEKVTLNDLAKEQKAPSTPPPSTAATTTKTTPKKTSTSQKRIEIIERPSVDIDRNDPKQQKSEPNTNGAEMQPDELMLSSSAPQKEAPNETAAATAAKSNDTDAGDNALPVKHLSEISIDLDNVTPTSEDILILDDDDIQITLNFTADRPSRYVSVIVISALNKSKMPVCDFQFEASVKKPCKVRLLPPSETVMSACRPFRPPTSITQVMLLLNTTRQAVDVTCIVSYKLGDDPDPVKESIVARDIPFVE